MEKLVEKGLVRSIGLSNFNSEQIARILSGCTIKPVMNQIEVSPTVTQKKMIDFCREHQIAVTAYSPLGTPDPQLKTSSFIFDDKIIAIGKRYNKTAAQVVLRYLVCNSRPVRWSFFFLRKIFVPFVCRFNVERSQYHDHSPRSVFDRISTFLISNLHRLMWTFWMDSTLVIEYILYRITNTPKIIHSISSFDSYQWMNKIESKPKSCEWHTSIYHPIKYDKSCTIIDQLLRETIHPNYINFESDYTLCIMHIDIDWHYCASSV